LTNEDNIFILAMKLFF